MGVLRNYAAYKEKFGTHRWRATTAADGRAQAKDGDDGREEITEAEEVVEVVVVAMDEEVD